LHSYYNCLFREAAIASCPTVMTVVMFMSVPVFMVMKVIVMMMLSASASSTHKRLSFYFITIDLIRSSRPFVIFIK